MNINAILMASGISRRFGEDKAFLPCKNTTFIEHILNLLVDSKILDIKAVINPKLHEYLSKKKLHEKIKLIKNDGYLKGQCESIRLGVESCENANGFMFLSLDQPFLSLNTINMIIDNFESGKIIVPKYSDKNGLPTIFDKKFSEELKNINGDIGGRDIIKKHINDVKFLHIKNSIEGLDIDTKQDFEKYKELM